MTRPSLPRRKVEDGDTNQPSRPLIPRLASAAGPWRTTRESGGYALGTARLPVHIGHAGAVDCIQKASIQSYTYVSSKWGSFPCAPNRHQPNEKPITVRRGEGGEERRGGPLWSPASWSLCSPAGGTLTYIMAHI